MPDAGAMREAIAKSRSTRGDMVSIWDACNAMLRGRQNVLWDRGRLFDLPTAPVGSGGRRRSRSVTNQLLQPYRTAQQLLRVRQPYFDIVGASTSYDDLTKAMAAQHLAKYLWHRNGMQKISAAAVRHMAVSSVAWLHTYWNPAEQRIMTEVGGGYDLLAEYGARSWEDSAWLAIRHTYERRVLCEAYPDHKEWLLNQQGQTVNDDGARPMPEERIDVWDVYWRHSGEHAVLCRDRYLWQGQTVKGVRPVVVAEWMRVEDELYGPSLLDQLLDLQRRYNHATNAIQDILDAHAAPVWLVPSNAGVSKGAINNAPDNVVTFRAGAQAPRREPAPPFSQELLAQPGRTQGEMMDVAGIHGSTYGKRTVGISSGRAIEALSERDEQQLWTTAESLRGAIIETVKNWLVLFKTYVSEAQSITYFDEAAGAVVHKELSAADLVDNPEVFVADEELFSAAASERDAKLMELWNSKLVQDPDIILKHLTFQVGGRKATQKMIALSHAQDLLEACKAGAEIQISPNDDTKTIRDVFADYMRSPQYYKRAMEAAEAFAESGSPDALAVYQREYDSTEYIAAVVAAIDTYGQPPEAYMQAATAKVFPRTDPKPDAQMNTIAATPSAKAQQQMVGSAMDMRTTAGQLQDATAAYDAVKGVRAGGGAVG